MAITMDIFPPDTAILTMASITVKMAKVPDKILMDKTTEDRTIIATSDALTHRIVRKTPQSPWVSESKIHHLNLSLGAFICLNNFNNSKPVKLLVDTGADISVIKTTNIDLTLLNNKDKTVISGIGEGTIQSLGSVCLELQYDNKIITFPFQAVEENFPIPCDGIIGSENIFLQN